MTASERTSGPRNTIGIVAGSGPEAGIDLWAKVLRHNADLMGDDFGGDLDAPRVVILSEPLLGLSMDLSRNETVVWEALKDTAAAISVRCDHWAIACNTLNWFAPRISNLGLPGEFVSFQSVLSDWIAASGLTRLGLLGAAPVTEMGVWSAYRALSDLVEVETPADAEALHALIHDVKRLGSADPTLRRRFKALAETMRAETLLLACTELPLIAEIETTKRLVDVTDLVAVELARRSLPRWDAAKNDRQAARASGARGQARAPREDAHG
ncbi:MAG: aspartate/glutamate racemase family protein [Rhodobacteraceae bacterium]|nr:aspartate/glutamate racemase family protein [Paracoccaceae bacterium]